jgi:CHAD domain-containing protein
MKTGAFTFRADESAKAGVLRIATALIEAALKRARVRGGDPGADVHLFRTTSKRLRALLQLVRPVIAKPAFARENARLKRAAARLAPFRDRAVADATLKSLRRFAAVSWLRGFASLDEKGRGSGRRETAMRQSARDFEMTRRAFQRLRICGDGWDAIGRGMIDVYAQARRRMKRAGSERSDRAFHRWRIRVKQLYYQLQWMEPAWPKRFGRMIGRLRKLEETLGTDHDLVILCALLEGAAPACDHAFAMRVEKAASKRRRCLMRISEVLGAKVLRESSRRFGSRCEQHWRAWQARESPRLLC